MQSQLAKSELNSLSLEHSPDGSPNVVSYQKRALLGCGLGCFSLIAMSLGAILLLLIASDTGFDGLLAGGLLACSPVPFYTGLALCIDRYEPEPPLLLFGAFMWGATFAVFVSYLLNTFNAFVLMALFGDGAQSWAAVLSAPWVEESAKGLGLFLLVLLWRREVDGIVDGVVYATMVALGFAMVENISYYGQAFHAGQSGEVGSTLFLRGVLSPYSHPLFTCMTGIGIGWARQTKYLSIKILAPVGGLMFAMMLHAMWNLTATVSGALWLVAYILIMIPVGLGILTAVGFALNREARLIREFLQPEVDQGVLSQEELVRITNLWGRLGYSVSALWRLGPLGWWNAEGFLHATTELAFTRHRATEGEVDQAEVDRRRAVLLPYLVTRPL
jgi:protease PrsW